MKRWLRMIEDMVEGNLEKKGKEVFGGVFEGG
jgi:hypothetical protein